MQYKVTTFRTVTAILNLTRSLLSITVCSTQQLLWSRGTGKTPNFTYCKAIGIQLSQVRCTVLTLSGQEPFVSHDLNEEVPESRVVKAARGAYTAAQSCPANAPGRPEGPALLSRPEGEGPSPAAPARGARPLARAFPTCTQPLPRAAPAPHLSTP